MIGVQADASEMEAAAELFELFKTPWEPAAPSRRYAAVLSTQAGAVDAHADLVLVYRSAAHPVDRRAGIVVEQVERGPGPIEAGWQDDTLPLYGRLAMFGGAVEGGLRHGGKALEYRRQIGSQLVCRFGYDLLQEVRFLLRDGQPARYAATPTLELHIALLRQRLLDAGVPLIEIPPRPDGFDFTCCLTHDVDFYGIRRHGFDLTLAGFIGRAAVAPVADLVLRRRPLADSARNWTSLLSLPLVLLGVAKDFWLPFEAYSKVEKDRPSTYFLIPFRDRPGVGPDATVTPARAVRYQVSDIREDLAGAVSRGTELAVHGIDAWRDADAGRAEMREVTTVTGQPDAGVRMHWLYFDSESPRHLESAGFSYDSTSGYNDAVGYRAGTSQVFKLPGTRNLLELSLTVMDTALFYRDRMGLSFDEAVLACRRLVSDARRFGGALVVNWHERSLAAERLWGRCYERLLHEAGDGNRAWFATAGDAVSWFRWRRSIQFQATPSGAVTINAPVRNPSLPAARVAVYRHMGGTAPHADYFRLDGREALTLEPAAHA